MINFQLLKYFETVARYEHFTRAANELFITQSTLSKAIDSLEKELGVRLFEKQGRNIQLTFYGKILRDYVQRGNAEIEKGIQVIQTLSNEQSGTVRIASVNSAGSFLLPQYMKGFSDLHADVRLSYHQKPTYRILDDLLNGDIDIGFCSNYEMSENYASICRERLLTEEIFLIVPENHPLSQRSSVEFDEIIDETWIGYNGETGMATAILNTARTAPLHKKLHFSYFASEDATVVGMVRSGLGIGMIPDSGYLNLNGVVKIHISKPFFFRNIYMVWNQDRHMSPPSRAFRKYIFSVIE